MKKLFILLTSLILCLAMTFTAFADQEVSNTGLDVAPSAETITADRTQLLTEAGLITDGELVIPQDVTYKFVDVTLGSGDSTEALIVTRTNGSNVLKDVYYSPERAISEFSSTSVDYPQYDDRLTIHGTATYVKYYNGSDVLYRPIGVLFSYTKTASASVTGITVTYAVNGYLFSYPGYQLLQTTPVSYSVSVSEANPVPSTVYQATNAYPTNRVLKTIGAGAGQYLNFSYTINGSYVYDSIWLGLM